MARNTQSARYGSSGTGDAGSGVRSAQPGVFRKEGGYWTVGYGGHITRLKDTRGLGYIAHLLRHPGAEFHVLDLHGGIANRREEDEAGKPVPGLPQAEQ